MSNEFTGGLSPARLEALKERRENDRRWLADTGGTLGPLSVDFDDAVDEIRLLHRVIAELREARDVAVSSARMYRQERNWERERSDRSVPRTITFNLPSDGNTYTFTVTPALMGASPPLAPATPWNPYPGYRPSWPPPLPAPWPPPDW